MICSASAGILRQTGTRGSREGVDAAVQSICSAAAVAEDEPGQESPMQSCFLYVRSSTGFGLGPLFPQNVIGQSSEEPKEPSFPKSGGRVPSSPLNIAGTLPGWHGNHSAACFWEPECWEKHRRNSRSLEGECEAGRFWRWFPSTSGSAVRVQTGSRGGFPFVSDLRVLKSQHLSGWILGICFLLS